MLYIIGEIEKLEKSKVGGKSSNLNDLKYKGIPVPAGLIIDNEYFKSDIDEDILSYLDKNKKYAVRSSAIDEDGILYSFAGLQDTYLNVSYEDVLSKVADCYQSQYNERALEYRKNFNIESSKGMSVIIQEMVDADYAGVIFTQNPSNNRIDEVVIELVEGLGEKLVSGHHTPTRYTISKDDNRIIDLKDNGVKLNKNQILSLMEYALKIEAIYLSSQDIEFAIKDDIVYILQARPITTIFKVPKQANKGLRFYLSFGHIQNMTYPMTPAGAEMLRSILSFSDHKFLIGRIVYNGEFLFIDMSEFLLAPEFLFKRIIKNLSNISFELPELAIEYRKLNKKRNMLPLSVIVLFIKIAIRVIKINHSKTPSSKEFKAWADTYYNKFLSYNEDELMLNINNMIAPIFLKIFPNVIAGMISFFRIKKLFYKWGLDKNDFQKLISGLEGNITTEMGLLYDDMLLYYGSEKGDKALADYLDKYGMRVDGEIDFGRSRPIEDIDSFKEKIKVLARQHDGNSLREKHQKRVAEANEIPVKLKDKLSKRKFNKLNHLIMLMKEYYVLREHPKYNAIRLFQVYRKLLNSPFELLSEKYNGGVSDVIIEERKEIYEAAYNKKVPIAMLSNGLILKPTMKNGDGDLHGFGVSSGIITAKVRVIKEITDDIIEEGEILVTKFTDPGWTPMLSKASGIITEVGGMMTHGAIVAREFGIPAVVGVYDAVNLLKTGDEIMLDGDSGEIYCK